MYIYITSLAYKDFYSQKRLIFLKQKLKDAGLLDIAKDIKIIGVDGKNVKPSDYIDKYLAGDFKFGKLKNMYGTIGSGLAHILCWEDIKKRNIQEDVLILEDDSDINKDFLKLIPNKFPEDYHVCYAHVYNQDAYDKGEYFDTNIRKCKNFNGVLAIHSYFINGRKIKDILKHTIPCNGPLDIEIGGNKNINRYILNPSLKISGQFALESIRMYYDDFYRNYSIQFDYPKNELEKISSDYTWKINIDATLLYGVSMFGNCINNTPGTEREAINNKEIGGAKIIIKLYIKDPNSNKNIDLFFHWGDYMEKDSKESFHFCFNIPKELNLIKNKEYSMHFEYIENEKSHNTSTKLIKPIKISRKFIYI